MRALVFLFARFLPVLSQRPHPPPTTHNKPHKRHNKNLKTPPSPPKKQVYLSGHGGNEFMKFQDTQELMAGDVADALAQMAAKGRYRELLLVVETCQAATLYSRVRCVCFVSCLLCFVLCLCFCLFVCVCCWWWSFFCAASAALCTPATLSCCPKKHARTTTNHKQKTNNKQTARRACWRWRAASRARAATAT